MQFLAEYGLFLAKAITWVIAILIVVGGVFAIIGKGKDRPKERLIVKNINEKYTHMADTLKEVMLNKEELKKAKKIKKQAEKEREQQISVHPRKRLFILDFEGDIKASAVANFREEVTAILMLATPSDEVVVRLESGGGMVHAYGLAASQLQRIKEKNIPLTVTVDKVAASGGYMMACVADRILAAPFAIIGSIGVLAQIPNFNRLLKKSNIDFEQITAGEYKRTLTVFGENTEKARAKFREDLEDIHELFKEFIAKHRRQINIQQVATGEHWIATRAIEMQLVDSLMTSDDYLLTASQHADLYQVSYFCKKSLGDKLSSVIQSSVHKIFNLADSFHRSAS